MQTRLVKGFFFAQPFGLTLRGFVFPQVPGAAAGSLAYAPMGARVGGRQPPVCLKAKLQADWHHFLRDAFQIVEYPDKITKLWKCHNFVY